MNKPLIRWRRDPLKQVVAVDRTTGIWTYARACTASREYIIVKLHNDDITPLNEDDRRFVVDNVTPREYDASQGAELPAVDRSR